MIRYEKRNSFIGIGTLLGLGWVLVVFNTVRAIQSDASVYSRLVGVAIPLALAFTLFAGTAGIALYGLYAQSLRIAGWTVLGTAAVTIAVALNIVGFENVRPDFTLALYMVVNAAAGGAVLGFLIGVYDAHQQQLQADLKHETERATDLSQRLSVINRVLRHDTRNQAQIIQSNTEKLLQDAHDPETAARTIQTANERLIELSEEARELESLLNRDTLENEAIDIVSTVQDAGETVQRYHENLEITYDLSDEQYVHAPPLIQQAFEQLFSNAAEHNDSEQSSVAVSLSMDTSHPQPVQLTLADNGPGIPDDEPILTDEDEETQLHHSRGVGLWFVTWVVDDAGGNIDIETSTNPDRGTTITLEFTLPPE
jgi:signal transduction histidine kinase